MSPRLHINEVAPRDGLQNEAQWVGTDDKVRLVDSLTACGFAKVEVTSFTSAAAIPMLRDAEVVMHRVQRRPGVALTVLVPNQRGAERALACGADELNAVMSLSETHNLANLRMPRQHSLRALKAVVHSAAAAGTPVNVSLSCAFGCPMEGPVPPLTVRDWAQVFADLGVRGLTLCDTTGMAHPAQVAELFNTLQRALPHIELTAHFHNTRGMGLANALAALQVGVVRFDASLGGLGGCPYAPGATGNVCTEDLVHMLQAMGADTGVDLHALLAVARGLPALLGHDLPGQVARAGTSLDLHPEPPWVPELRQRHAQENAA